MSYDSQQPFFDLFGSTSDSRSLVRYEMEGINHLVKFLDRFFKDGSDELNDQTAQLCCETLKIIFNLLLATDQPENTPEEQQHRLMEIIRQILSLKSTSLERREELKRFKTVSYFIDKLDFISF